MLIIYTLLTCLMFAVMLSDTQRYRIPNGIVLALLALYPVAVYVAHGLPDWKTACLVCLITFAVGIVLILPFMGAGDVKLLTACSLYVNKGGMLDFIVLVAILGGIGSLLLLALRAITPFVFMKLRLSAESIPRVLSHKEPVPYGVAIAGAFLWMLWSNTLPGFTL